MEVTTRSILGAHLQSCMLLQQPLTLVEHSTLNEKFGVAQDELPTDSEYPALNVAVIGNGGHTLAVTSKGIYYPKAQVHRPDDFALFSHIPFVCREINNDLSTAERLKYRLRVIDYIDNKPYVVYYGKVIDLANATPTVSKVTVANGITSMIPFTGTKANLSPVPVDLSSTTVNTTTGDYLASNSIAVLDLDSSAITEIINACDIMFGDKHTAVISEIGLCTSLTKQVYGDFNGNQQKYTEATCCQLYSSSACFHDLLSTGAKLGVNINVGAAEPLVQ